MKKVLLTGSTGFIGSNLLRELYHKNQMFLILRSNSKNNYILKDYKNIKIIYYDRFDDLDKKLKKLTIDIVIHCATHYVRNHSFGDILQLNNSNIIFGNIILENLKLMKVKKFINFSTVWEDYDAIKNNNCNLYAAYKKSFTNIINYYTKILPSIKFFNLMISDTFGENDNRYKIINVLKKNYKKNKATKIVSKNLHINLLNIKDITQAVHLLMINNIRSGQYLLKNKFNYRVIDLINLFNNEYEKKIKVKWLSNKIIKEKIFPYKKLVGWFSMRSSKIDIIKIIRDK